MEMLTAAVTLFLIMDPLGNLPIFISVLKGIDSKRQRIILIRELIIALGIMLLFLFAGQKILDFLHLRQESVSIAGGIILFLIAIKMIFPSHGSISGLPEGEEPFLVPLAVPMMAGPSILAALILMANQDPNRMTDWALALIIAWSASAVILFFSSAFQRILGNRGLTAMERLMGMILVMIAVQMLLDGIANYLG
ncbi:YhgN family NAAT transporter [Thalassotalea sp. HSM 43]|uniref:YhgN family NAAT transporter n=1 Tax=Thalassotalea sp. HSM 43 TaxID=2552945 RepID=UPI0010803654|nr:YhgN family NAAT transporter [Thalassotalea sp. HSM 43]QBY04296.1 YhgN family NAAT transporter [Thalassotalea sp. HSM 43]